MRARIGFVRRLFGAAALGLFSGAGICHAASSVVKPLDFTVTKANPTVGALFSALGANQATLTISNTAAQFIDVAVTNHSTRFYRGLLQ